MEISKYFYLILIVLTYLGVIPKGNSIFDFHPNQYLGAITNLGFFIK